MAHAHEFELQFTPDILILPSQLSPFAKRVEDVLCINPGRITKGSSAGTFSQLTVHPIIRNIVCHQERPSITEIEKSIEVKADSGSERADAVLSDPGVNDAQIKPLRLSVDFDAVNMGDVRDLEKLTVSADPIATESKAQILAEKNSSPVNIVKPVDIESQVVDLQSDANNIKTGDASGLTSSSEMDATRLSNLKGVDSGTLLKSMTHRVMERTRVDIIRL